VFPWFHRARPESIFEADVGGTWESVKAGDEPFPRSIFPVVLDLTQTVSYWPDLWRFLGMRDFLSPGSEHGTRSAILRVPR
jgi:hypothetical protein